MDRRTFTVSQVAEMLGISEPAIYRHISAGRIKVVRLGRRVLVLKNSLERLLQPEV